jgi:hypothetical protein
MATEPNFLAFQLSDIIMIGAVFIGPIAAVQVQKFIEAFRERRTRQNQIFRILMATRGARVSHDHTTALNLIDVDFSDKKKKEKPIVRAWRSLHDKYNKYPDPKHFEANAVEYDNALRIASDNSEKDFVELLFEMSKFLGYDYEKPNIKNGAYTPKGHADQELEENLIKRLTIAVLAGDKTIGMDIQSLPAQEPNEDFMNLIKSSAEKQEKIIEILTKISSGEIKIPVTVQAPVYSEDLSRRPITGSS